MKDGNSSKMSFRAPQRYPSYVILFTQTPKNAAQSPYNITSPLERIKQMASYQSPVQSGLPLVFALMIATCLIGILVLLPTTSLAEVDQTPPTNDNLADAIQITPDNLTQQVDLTNATQETSEVSCIDGYGESDPSSVWYQISPTEQITVNITVLSGDDVEPVIGLFTGTAHPLKLGACANDGRDNEQHVIDSLVIGPGETWLIRVSGFGQNVGPVEIRFEIVGEDNGGREGSNVNTWTGNESSDWSTGGNWSTGTAPQVNDGNACTIPASTTNPPINIQQAFGCDGTLTVEANAVFTASGDYGGLSEPLYNGLQWVINGTVVIPNDYVAFQSGMDVSVAEGGTIKLFDGSIGGFSVDGKPNRLAISGTLSVLVGNREGEQAGENKIERGTPLTILPTGIVEIHEGARLVADGVNDGSNTVTNNGTISQTTTVTQTTEIIQIRAINEGQPAGIRYYGIRFEPAQNEEGQVQVGILGNHTCNDSDTTSVQRCFYIDPNSIPSANIRFYFLNSESNNNQNPVLYRSASTNGPWAQIESEVHNLDETDYSYVEASNLQDYGYFRLADAVAAPSSGNIYLPMIQTVTP